MKKGILISLVVLFTTTLSAQDYNYQFRLNLKDKGKSDYSIDRPEEYLSQKSIERRHRQGISISKIDVPISPKYIEEIKAAGGKIAAKSKWLSSVTVHCKDSLMIDNFLALPFVDSAVFVWRGKAPQSVDIAEPDTINTYPIKEEPQSNYYGKMHINININNGQALHDAGYKGKDMTIAVIDAGFRNLPKIEMLDNVNILGHKSFVYQKNNLFDNEANTHGLMVLSCIGTNKPNQAVGTAPEADFWILGSEDTRSEFPVEEDYWVMAAEFADSVGVDVINTSLGYAEFDKPAQSHTRAQLDGRTNYITKGANIAADRGMLLVTSAGNSGNDAWYKITSPADAPNVLTIGAIQSDSIISPFSSRGLTSDGRIKPDVMALGSRSTVINDKGLVGQSYGTSFSSPIMCGMVACLWQAFPSLTNKEIIRVVRESSDKFYAPDANYGYGIPDMAKAMEIAQNLVDRKEFIKKQVQQSTSKKKK